MTKDEITGKLKTLIEEQNDITIESLDAELEIDSFTMMMVITFVKEEMGAEIEMDDLDFDAFTSLNTFADLVLKSMRPAA